MTQDEANQLDDRVAWLERKMVRVLWLLVSVTSAFAGFVVAGFFFVFLGRLAAGYDYTLQLGLLERYFIAVVVIFDVFARNLPSLFLQDLVKLLRQHSGPRDVQQFLELRSLIQTHLVSLMSHH